MQLVKCLLLMKCHWKDIYRQLFNTRMSTENALNIHKCYKKWQTKELVICVTF